MNIGIIYLAIYVACIAATRWGLSKLFVKAGEEGWKAWVPVYSELIWVKLLGKPVWWAILKLVPIARTLIRLSMNIETAKAFGRYDFKDHALAVLAPFYYFPKLGLDAENSPSEVPQEGTSRRRSATSTGGQAAIYLGPPAEHKNVPLRTGAREWGDAILYAGTAAMIIRSLFLEAFMIPTTSMEKTLLAGDFLFVSKFHFGVRMPMIPLAFPFVHNKLPLAGAPSYISALKLPYYRLPGLKSVERNDIVVFNYPGHDAHELNDGAGRVKEVSMKENYIKRCVAVAGDVIEVKLGQLHINGKPAENPENFQYTYQAANTPNLSAEKLEALNFRLGNPQENQNVDFFTDGRSCQFSTTPKIANEMAAQGLVTNLTSVVIQKPDSFMGMLYPNWYNESKMGGLKAMEHNNLDNFGPLKLPKKGEAIPLTAQNYPLYKRCIEEYEGHTLEQKGDKFVIDGKETTQYIPEMNYYWMMGDNRHNSEDSRFWGFVPEDHIIGTPVFIFFSTEKFFDPRTWRLGRLGTGKIK